MRWRTSKTDMAMAMTIVLILILILILMMMVMVTRNGVIDKGIQAKGPAIIIVIVVVSLMMNMVIEAMDAHMTVQFS